MNWLGLRPLEWLLLVEVILYMSGIVWFLWGMRRGMGGANQEQPFISVVVAARNEEAHIVGCLSRLAAQDYPHFEVVIVDDGSTDATAALVADSVGKDGRFRLIQRKEGGSKKAALTAAIAQAKGEVIAATDADCLMGSGWLGAMVACLEADVGMVIGFSQIGMSDKSLGVRGGYEAVDFLNLMACIWGSSGRGHPMAASGQNLLFRRAAYDEVGGYQKVIHRVSGDDVLLMQMIRNETEWNIAFSTDRASFTVHPFAGTWKGLLNQRARWASNAPLMLKLDPLFYGYMLITYVLSLCVVLSPLLVLGGWVQLGWMAWMIGVKWSGEAIIFLRANTLSRRLKLSVFWPLWALIQPLHVVLVGGLGVLGAFSWKGKRHRWGQTNGGK